MARSTPESRRKARIKAGFSVYYVIFFIFVYGPMFAMFTLSFQGPRGGVTFPMRGFSFYWWEKLTGPSAVGDLKASLVRSLILAVIVMIITALFSTMLAMAFRKRFRGSGALFYGGIQPL
jgi:putative spermidine/putrescine transport system permease protein